MISSENRPRKIIHIDMDCFYAAIEIRDNPSLTNKPVAVGGPSHRRGVICTCNYIARQYGVRSAMPTSQAYQQCDELILLPVNMPKYKQVAKRIQEIFHEFTDLVEPLALDEAYLDVTDSAYCRGSATLIAQEIRRQIWEREKLPASAGIASNKFLAKIASGWNKPNGLFVILPQEISTFIQALPVTELYGVGKVNAEKLHRLNLLTCADLQKLSLLELSNQVGKKLGQRLYEQCRGIDSRCVEPNRIRKSLSVEQTFSKDISHIQACSSIINALHDKLLQRIQEVASCRDIKSQYVKIKFNDFKLITAEVASNEVNLDKYHVLLCESYAQQEKPIRLLGLGIHFQAEKQHTQFIPIQQTLF